MENQLSEVLDNILGLLLLEGSYEIEEEDTGFFVSIDTKDAGRLIGAQGQSLEALQLIINQIIFQKQKEDLPAGGFKRVVLDVSGWRKQKEEDLRKQAQVWGKQVLETREQLELEPQSPWQRRVVHMVIGEMEGVETESLGEGRDRHIMIKVKSLSSERKSRDKKAKVKSAKTT